MRQPSLSIEQIHSAAISPELERAILALLCRAFEEDLDSLYRTMTNATHLLGRVAGTLVTHLMWVTRYLEPAGGPRLETAYIEMVATEPAYQGRGFASTLLARVPAAVAAYELAALCPATAGIYQRLGWRYWRGDLYIRTAGGLVPTPEERVLIYELPRTPRLDYDADLSAEWRPGEVW